MNKKEIGKIGEDISVKFLENNSIKVINKNFFTKFGEIDLIGLSNKTIIFIEVKLRNNQSFGSIYESITSYKKKRMQKAAQIFLSNTDIIYDECRFDVIFLIYDRFNGGYKIEWLKNQDFN